MPRVIVPLASFRLRRAKLRAANRMMRKPFFSCAVPFYAPVLCICINRPQFAARAPLQSTSLENCEHRLPARLCALPTSSSVFRPDTGRRSPVVWRRLFECRGNPAHASIQFGHLAVFLATSSGYHPLNNQPHFGPHSAARLCGRGRRAIRVWKNGENILSLQPPCIQPQPQRFSLQ